MGVVRVKPGVDLRGLQSAGIRILAKLDHCAEGLDVDLTISCGTEGHALDDPHSKGQALDVRTSDLATGLVVKVYTFLTTMLGAAFTILYEVPTLPDVPELATIAYVNKKASAPHFHIQLKRGTVTWPPDRMLA